MDNVCDHMFVTEKLANRFITLKDFKKYNDTDIEHLLFCIFSKTINNDFIIDDRLCDNSNLFATFIPFHDDLKHKRSVYYEIQVRIITSWFDKKIKENKPTYYSLEETLKRIRYKKSSAIPIKVCMAICEEIIKKQINSSFAELFVLISKYIFKDKFNEKFLKENHINYEFSSFSHTQFLLFKDSLDKNIESYNKKTKKGNKDEV